MKGNVYTLCYAGVLGVVCSVLLTAASSMTAPYKAANVKAEEFLNILRVLDVPFEAEASPKELVEIFDKNVRHEKKGEVIFYEYRSPVAEGQIQAAAVEFSGPGLWGPIKGFLALEPDMKTIRGISFYEQEETPGLGGEIGSSWFQEQFVGKSIMDESGRGGLVIAGGKSERRNEVDAITGATMTCDKVQEILNGVIKIIIEETDSNG